MCEIYIASPRSIAALDPSSGAIEFGNLPRNFPLISHALSENPVHDATARGLHSESANQTPSRTQHNQLSETCSPRPTGPSQSPTPRCTQLLSASVWRDPASTYAWHSTTRSDTNSDRRKGNSRGWDFGFEGFGFRSVPTSPTSSASECRHRIIVQAEHQTPIHLKPMNQRYEPSKEDLCPR